MLEHFFKVALISFHVNVLSIISIRRPGIGCIGSTGLSINNDLFRHGCNLLLNNTYPPPM
jgi:hypothetical protein